MLKTHLLLIDPQHDFCDSRGTLFVPGAEEDMSRVAHLIHHYNLDRIHVSMDWHQPVDIAHSIWFIDDEGNHPEPFSKIFYEDMEKRKWRTTDPKWQTHTLLYLKKLEESGRYDHTIWPEHCLAGSQGSNVVPIVGGAIARWCRRNKKRVSYIIKGDNALTEHFSAVKAEVPVAWDPKTKTNVTFLSELNSASRILVAGEASSHCVAATVMDLIDCNKSLIPKLEILTDCMSAVPGFKKEEEIFFNAMEEQGVKMTESTQL